jgi:hypothetical protein
MGVDWINLRIETSELMVLVNTVMNIRVPQKASNFFSNQQLLKKDFAPWTLLVQNKCKGWIGNQR